MVVIFIIFSVLFISPIIYRMVISATSTPVILEVTKGSETARKLLSGTIEIIYECPQCHQNLKSDSSDIGYKDTCPLCQCDFIVPGNKALSSLTRMIYEMDKIEFERKVQAEAEIKRQKEQLRRKRKELLAKLNSSLTNCRACHYEVHKKAYTCPKCGCPDPYYTFEDELLKERIEVIDQELA